MRLRRDERQLCSLSRSTWMPSQQNCLFSHRTSPSPRPQERPLVSKCVIMVSFGAVCLTEWPSDLFHLLTVLPWLWRPKQGLWATASHGNGSNNVTSVMWGAIRKVRRWEALKMDIGMRREDLSELPVSGIPERPTTAPGIQPRSWSSWDKFTTSQYPGSILKQWTSIVALRISYYYD